MRALFTIAVLVCHSLAIVPVAESATFRLYDEWASSVQLIYGEADAVADTVPMERIDYGVWASTLDLAPGTYHYHFEIDGKWRVSDLNSPHYLKRDDGLVVSVLAIGEHREASPDETRFSIRIEHVAPGASRVQIAGEFSGWSPQAMHSIGGDAWRAELHLPAGRHAYKFIVDGQWILDPANPETKEVGGVINSALIVPQVAPPSNEVRDVPVVAADSQEGAVNVSFALYAPMADTVSLVGTMNDWSDAVHPLLREDSGMWRGVFPLRAGSYEYKFKVDQQWWLDPNNPHTTQGEPQNSLLTVTEAPEVVDRSPWDITRLRSGGQPIFFQAGTGLHPFQQELLRAFLYVGLADQQGLAVRDGTLLLPLVEADTAEAAHQLGWDVRMENAQPMMILRLGEDARAHPLRHPLLDPPHVWLADLREQRAHAVGADTAGWPGDVEPPADSDWAAGLRVRDEFTPFAGIYAVNAMTRHGREHGWSRALSRDLAVTYADLAGDIRYPSTGGRAVPVFAARAVAYADWARGDEEHDEVLAYVLARIGRPGDAIAFLPDTPGSFLGRLARAYAMRDLRDLVAWAGTADQYGLSKPPGFEERAAAMEDLTPAQRSRVLRAVAELSMLDEQTNVALTYLMAHLEVFPHDLAAAMQACGWGGVSSGHRYAKHILQLAGDPVLWRAVLSGEPPVISPMRVRTPRAPAKDALADRIAETTALARQSRADGLDSDDAAIPQSARWLLLKDQLDAAWWRNAHFYGRQYSSRSGAEQLNRQFAPWKEVSPVVGVFVRILVRNVMNDRGYDAMRHGLIDSGFGPHSMALMRLVKQTYTTWLFDEGQAFHRLTSFAQSDLVQDYLDGWHIHSLADERNYRAGLRAVDPMGHHGYPAGRELPVPDRIAADLPGTLPYSYGLHVRMGEAWRWQRGVDAARYAVEFYRSALEIQPFETGPYPDLVNMLLDRGEYAQVLELLEQFPDTPEALRRVRMERLASWAALGQGDVERATTLARRAAESWQGDALREAGALHEVLSEHDKAVDYYTKLDERYDGRTAIYHQLRHYPEQGHAQMEEDLAWLDEISDEQLNSGSRGFSFNACIQVPYDYWCLGKPERALWFLKPQAEAVQNDYTWFLLMAVARVVGDQQAFELGRHVLGDHVGKDYGEFARFLRGDRSWHDVMEATRHHGNVQAIHYLASILADERGDSDLAIRFLCHALSPRHGSRAWFTLTWQNLQRRGEDPMRILRQRYLPAQEHSQPALPHPPIPDKVPAS